MSVPAFTRAANLYRAEWKAPEMVRVEVINVRTERTGDVTGELAIYSTAPEEAGLLHQARLTMTGTRSRSDMAGYLAKRTPKSEIDWPGIIEATCLKVIAAFRAGEPVCYMRDLPPVDRDTLYAIPPIVLARNTTIWFGDGGSGKSYLALAAAAAIHTGRGNVMGLYPAVQHNVGWADWEFSGEDNRDRLERLLGSGLPDMPYVRCDTPLVAEVGRLQTMIREYKLGMLVIDSIGAACDGPPESAESANAFARAIRQLGVPVLAIAHVNRSGDESRPFGSQFWHNQARSTWYVKQSSDNQPGRLSVALFNKKANTGTLSAPVAFDITFDEIAYTTRIALGSVHDSPEFSGRLTVKTRMVEALRREAKTFVEIAEEIDADVPAVQKVAQRGYDKEFVKVVGSDGVFRVGLAAHQETPNERVDMSTSVHGLSTMDNGHGQRGF